MIIHNKNKFKVLKRTIDENNINCPTFAYSILDGFIQGTVYGDSEKPKTILIGTSSGIYFVAGEADNFGFNHSLFEMFRQRKNRKLRFTLFSSSEKWNCTIRNEFKQEVKQLDRLSFSYNLDRKIEEKRLLSSEYSIEKITPEFIKNSLEFNEEYYTEYWGSPSNFIENGIGFCVVHNGKVISECTSIFSSQDFAEIDIVTHEDYRGKGLAAIIANTFIEHCLKNSVTPKWDCDVSNYSSIKLAEKLGFASPVEYSIFV